MANVLREKMQLSRAKPGIPASRSIIRHRVLTNQRDRSYVYAVVSLAAGGPFVGGPIVTYIFSRVVSVVRACVYGKRTVTSDLWLNIA